MEDEKSKVEMAITVDSDLRKNRLVALMKKKDRYKPLLRGIRCTGLDQVMMEYCQSILDEPLNFESEFGKSILVLAQRMSKATGVVPRSYELGEIPLCDRDLEVSGGFADVYKTVYQGNEVCVKKLRPPKGIPVRKEGVNELRRQIAREGILWYQLRHPNILPLIGIPRSYFPCLVSPWMDHGHIRDYLKNNSSANRYFLTNDILRGLEYLHRQNLIHGDLKGANVLIDTYGHALLADFGLSSFFDKTIPTWTSQSTVASRGGTLRWQAPELLERTRDGKPVCNTKETDIFAWACVCYEVFTGELPPWEEKPARPEPGHNAWNSWGLNEDIWSVMEMGWAESPAKRPTVQELLLRLQPLAINDDRPPSRGYAFPRHSRPRQSLVDSLVEIEKLLAPIAPI